MKKRLLWVGDSPTVATGFGRATQHICAGLLPRYEVEVLGMHFNGDPHSFPYEIWPTKRDVLGAQRLPDRCKAFQPDVIVLQNDVWNIPYYTSQLKKAGITTPVVAALAVDGKNVQSTKLKGVSLAIFWTQFAEEEARLGGWTGPTAVIPLGIDLDTYKLDNVAHIEPLREHARSLFDNAPDSTFKIDIERFRKGFVVVNVNRNQVRKRLDLLVDYFCEWVLSKKIDDAYLMIQACPTGEQEYDVAQLMDYHGLLDRLFLIYPDIEVGVPEKNLVWTYRCADVGMTTTQGEGFGLTTFEMMACGIPQIVPDWAALGELCANAALTVPCTSFAATQAGINVIGGIADRQLAVAALDLLYTRRDVRQELTRRGLERVREDRFRWSNIGAAYCDAIDRLLDSSEPLTEEVWTDLGRPQEADAVQA